MQRLTGKTAIITGGNSGIGFATARRFVEEGAFVFITGRRQSELDKAVAAIGSNITAIQGDVSSLDDLDRLYATVQSARGGIDILFANAGILEPLTTSQATPEHYDRVFDINARGVYFTVQKALPLLRDNASIIVNGSGAWTRGIPSTAPMPPPKPLCALSSAPGQRNSPRAAFAPTSSAPAPSTLPSSTSSPPSSAPQ